MMNSKLISFSTVLLYLLCISGTIYCNTTTRKTAHNGTSKDSVRSKENTHNTTKEFVPCTQSISIKHLFLAVFSTMVLIVGVIGNSLVIIVIWTSHHLRRQTTYLFLASLAAADLGVSLFVTTVKVDMYTNNGSFCHSFKMCIFFHFTDSIFPVASISNLLVIGVDRWYAISNPFTYIIKMTSRTARRTVAGVWCYSLLWTLLGAIKWNKPVRVSYEIITVGVERYCYSDNRIYYTAVIVIIFIIPMVVTTTFYIVVLCISLKQATAISKYIEKKGKWLQLGGIGKGIKTVGIAFAAYAISWFPHVVVVILQYWFPRVLNEFHAQDPLRYDVVTTIISNILPPINSCINPFIYFIFSVQFRVAFKDFLFKLIKSHRHALNMYGEESCALPLVDQNPSRVIINGQTVVGHRWSLTQLPKLIHSHHDRRKSCTT